MRTLVEITAMAFAVAAIACGCAGSTGGDAPFVICPDSSAVVQAAQMASTLTPAEAARSMTAWMSRAELSDMAFARCIYTELRREYADRAAELDRSLDSLHRSMPVEERARLMVVSASPERVAAALVGDSTTCGLTEAIERAYTPDTALLRRFRQAIQMKY